MAIQKAGETAGHIPRDISQFLLLPETQERHLLYKKEDSSGPLYL